jgi:hypothetical protein
MLARSRPKTWSSCFAPPWTAISGVSLLVKADFRHIFAQQNRYRVAQSGNMR